MWWLVLDFNYLHADRLSLLLFVQVAIIVGFFGTKGSSGTRVFIQRTIINVALVLQYLPRVAQIYLSSKKFRMSGKWIKPSLNLFLYLLASHVSFISNFIKYIYI